MSSEVFEVVLHVPGSALATILGTLTGECSLISVTKRTEEPKPKTSRFANGKRNKGISGHDLAMKLLKSAKREFSYAELAHAFQREGFAPNSVSPVLSGLVKDKEVKALGQGFYALPNVKVTVAAKK